MALKDVFENLLKLSFLLSILVTLPFALLTVLGQIENEAGLILIFPFVAGLPWILIYMKLPIDIAGLNSPISGALNLVQLFFMMLPVYINIFLINFIVSSLMKRKNSFLLFLRRGQEKKFPNGKQVSTMSQSVLKYP